MISRDEYLNRVMNRLRYRRLATLHNGEKRTQGIHLLTCPCVTTPHTAEEMDLLGTIEHSLDALLKIFEARAEGAKSDSGERPWTDTTSTK